MAQSLIPRASRPEVVSILADNLLAQIGLFTNDIGEDDNLTFAGIIEPTFGGYVTVRVGHWTPGQDVDGVGVTWGDPVIFTWDGVGVAPTVRGYYARHAPAGGLLWYWQATGAGFTFSLAVPRLIVVPRLNLRREQV